MIIFNAKLRTRKGKSASRQLRSSDKFPAIIYGGKFSPIPIELDHHEIWNLQDRSEFYNEIITIIINGEKEEKVKVQDIQRHVFKPKLSHIDFIRTKLF